MPSKKKRNFCRQLNKQNYNINHPATALALSWRCNVKPHNDSDEVLVPIEPRTLRLYPTLELAVEPQYDRRNTAGRWIY
jgi:hypothetical protein